jgi:hypothetical protein
MRSIVLWLHYVILSFQMDADDDGYDDEFDWDGGCVWNQNMSLFPERTPTFICIPAPNIHSRFFLPFQLKGRLRVAQG